ncbi:MAG: hypothetical protein LBH13_05665 [Cellulomonadaceae bacterium]|nr:hypothetical protein [Cellulomonadaceae bacterium]
MQTLVYKVVAPEGFYYPTKREVLDAQMCAEIYTLKKLPISKKIQAVASVDLDNDVPFWVDDERLNGYPPKPVTVDA